MHDVPLGLLLALATVAAVSVALGVGLIKVADTRLGSDTSRLARAFVWWPLAGVGLLFMVAPILLVLAYLLNPMLVIDWHQLSEWLPA